MMRIKGFCRQALLTSVGLSFLSIASFADSLAAYNDALKSTWHALSTLKPGHPLLQLGGYWSTLGSEQHINILSLIGNDHTVTKRGGSNGLVGVGYFVDGKEKDRYVSCHNRRVSACH